MLSPRLTTAHRKKDGRISGLALVPARGSSKDRSRDPVTSRSAESAVCQLRPGRGCRAQCRALSGRPRAGCLRIKVCAEREDLFCFSNALSTSEEHEKCGFHDVPKCWGVNVCEPVCRDVCLCVCVFFWEGGSTVRAPEHPVSNKYSEA